MAELSDRVKVSLRREIDESYDIVFGSLLFPQIAEDLKANPIGSKHAIITDSNVKILYAEQLEKALKKAGLEVQAFSFEAGEKNKTIDSCMSMMGDMSSSGYGRDSAILALGGGVVGDMAGFMAAIYMRGIPYIQIPTTVLAQADSSIGGKTAVDTEHGKNLVGSFKQPKRVYIDVATLETLPARHYSAGLAETIKHAIIQDPSFFDYLSGNINSVVDFHTESSLYIARNNCRIKGRVVEQDPEERGLRKILNYGHTIGHAIEALSGYRLLHGEAVAIGMMAAGRIANMLGHFSGADLERQMDLLIAYGLPVAIPPQLTDEAIVRMTLRDKKARDGRAMYVLPRAIGQMHEFDGKYATYVDNEIVVKALKQTRALLLDSSAPKQK